MRKIHEQNRMMSVKMAELADTPLQILTRHNKVSSLKSKLILLPNDADCWYRSQEASKFAAP